MSLVGRVYLLVLLAAAPAFGLQLYQDLEQRTAGERQVGQEALRLVRFASSDLDKVLEGARAFLVAVAANPDVQAGDAAGCNRYFQGLGAPFPPIRGATLIDPSGRIVCASRPDVVGMSVADRSYFTRAMATREFAVGELVTSRTDGGRSLPVALPIVSPNGVVAGVVATGLDAAKLQELFKDKAWPEGGSISIIDRSGTIVVRWPNPELVGQKLPDQGRWMLDAPAEGTTTGTGPDGIERIGAFVPPAANRGLLIRVALSKSAALAPLDAAMRRDLLLLGGTAALAFAAAVLGSRYFIRRPVDALTAAATRLRGGDLGARAALPDQGSELGRLGAAFDEMAGAMQERERALRRSEELFRQFAEHLPEVVWVENAASGEIEYVGPAYEAVWHRPAAEVVAQGAGWLDAVRDADRPRLVAALQRARSGEATTAEYRIQRPDGEERWLHSTAFPIRDQGGLVVRLARLTRDVTERRRLEIEREHALEQRNLLFRELNHRIRNNLQIVGALLRLQSGRLSDPEAKAALDAAGQRIGAVGELHVLLDRGGSDGTLDFGDYLSRLCESLGDAMIEDGERVRIECRAVHLPLDMDQAVPLALIASELITNSLKYAYPPPAAGEVLVQLVREPGERARLAVRDHGPGFEGEPTAGFGLGIIRLFTSQLGATLTLTGTDGVTAEVEFAVSARIAQAAA